MKSASPYGLVLYTSRGLWFSIFFLAFLFSRYLLEFGFGANSVCKEF